MSSHRIRTVALAFVASLLVAAAAWGIQPPTSAQAASTPLYLRHPAKNIKPGAAFESACYSVKHSAASQQRCVKAALVVYAKARAKEGLTPLVLPKGFTAMSDVKQLLVLVNLERIDRGLTAMKGLSPALDALSKDGAQAGGDPVPPAPPSDLVGSWAAASNWAGAGTSTLLDSFYWMYDDGLNSGNIECEGNDMSGCWGHRDDILLRAGQAPYVMGAASLPNSTYGASMTELFVGGDPHLAVSTPWAPIAKTVPLGISAKTISTSAATHHVAKKKLVVYASGYGGKVTLKVTKAPKSWTVSRASCTLKAGHGCTVTITFHTVKKGAQPGVLTVKGPRGALQVKLAGRGR